MANHGGDSTTATAVQQGKDTHGPLCEPILWGGTRGLDGTLRGVEIRFVWVDFELWAMLVCAWFIGLTVWSRAKG